MCGRTTLSKDQPVDPALDPPPTTARIARALLDQTAEPRSATTLLPIPLPTLPVKATG